MSTPKYVQDRERVSALVETNFDEALTLAREIDHPWYRCQSLAYVALKAPDTMRSRQLINEAFGAAKEQKEPNRVVTVSAWPLQALSEDASPEELSTELKRLDAIIATEPHPVRRCDALYMVADFLKDGPRVAFLEAVNMCAKAAHEGHGWKRDRNLRDLAMTLWNKGEKKKSEAMLEEIEDPRVKRQTLRQMT